VVAFLVPGKIATAGYAAPAREELARRTTISVVAELGPESGAVFDATVYPMALIASLVPPADSHRLREGLGNSQPGISQRGLGASPWPRVPAPAREVLHRLTEQLPPLGEFVSCHLGVKTGLNRVFLDPPLEVEPELLRWAIRGRDVRPFQIRPTRRLLWPCDGSGRVLDALPEMAARHVARHAAVLRRRADHAGGPLWALFRTTAASAPHRVIWADLSQRLEAVALTGARGGDAIPLNSCYVAAVPNPDAAFRLSAWLNSTWCRTVAAAVADPASGGYARFNARVVSSLPCPPAMLTDVRLHRLGRRAAAGDAIQEDLDDCCADILALSPTEREVLAGVARARGDPRR
jgi:hypothetical protein